MKVNFTVQTLENLFKKCISELCIDKEYRCFIASALANNKLFANSFKILSHNELNKRNLVSLTDLLFETQKNENQTGRYFGSLWNNLHGA